MLELIKIGKFLSPPLFELNLISPIPGSLGLLFFNPTSPDLF